jgi:hypothetical protein
VRRIAEMEAAESQLVPLSAVDRRKFPDAASIPFLAPVDMYEVTSEEYAESAWRIRIYADDAVEVGPTREQMLRQSELIGRGYKHGRINDEGDWQPTALNPSTGEWRDIKPGDVVIQGGSVAQVEDGTFHQTDEQRIGNLFNPASDNDE